MTARHRSRPTLFGHGRGPDVRDFGDAGHVPLVLSVAVAARVTARLATLDVSAEAALLLGIATLEREAQAVKAAARDRADVLPLPVHPWRKPGDAPMRNDDTRLAEISDTSDISDRLVEV